MRPVLTHGLGSGASPRKRAAGRASMTWNSSASTPSRTSIRPMTTCGSNWVTNVRAGRVTGAASTGSPSARHFGSPPKWRAEGLPVEAAPVTRPARTFVTQFDPHVVIGLIDVRDGVLADEFQVIDARPAARFRGEAPEPRPWVKTGRIPGSYNVPSTEL